MSSASIKKDSSSPQAQAVSGLTTASKLQMRLTCILIVSVNTMVANPAILDLNIDVPTFKSPIEYLPSPSVSLYISTTTPTVESIGIKELFSSVTE